MAEPGIAGLTFEEALEFFASKVRVPTRTWLELWQRDHNRAFTVAGAMRDDLLADFQEAIRKAIEQGTTLQEFREDFDRIVARHGWSYRGSRGWRTRVIYETNLRTAYHAGRWKQMERVARRRPYLMYSAILDDRVRPQHRAWHGTVLPMDHEWWSTHYPPNGWGCRCTAIQMSARQVRREGLEIDDEAPPGEADPGWEYNVGESGWAAG